MLARLKDKPFVGFDFCHNRERDSTAFQLDSMQDQTPTIVDDEQELSSRQGHGAICSRDSHRAFGNKTGKIALIFVPAEQ